MFLEIFYLISGMWGHVGVPKAGMWGTIGVRKSGGESVKLIIVFLDIIFRSIYLAILGISAGGKYYLHPGGR